MSWKLKNIYSHVAELLNETSSFYSILTALCVFVCSGLTDAGSRAGRQAVDGDGEVPLRWEAVDGESERRAP